MVSLQKKATLRKHEMKTLSDGQRSEEIKARAQHYYIWQIKRRKYGRHNHVTKMNTNMV